MEEIVGAWRGAPSKLEDTIESDQAGQLAWGADVLKSKKKGKKWDPETKRDRLTNALMYMHSRGASSLTLSRYRDTTDSPEPTAIPSLFSIFVDGDVREDPKHMVAWLTQDGLGLPAKDYYKDKETLEVYEEVVRATLKSVYLGRGEKHADSKELARGVVKFEKKLAQISLDACVACLVADVAREFGG